MRSITLKIDSHVRDPQRHDVGIDVKLPPTTWTCDARGQRLSTIGAPAPC